ncbi:phosphoribosyltransferase [Akkermansia muciniphila]|uniref:phosphoribosyltransferase n=1 Tax=Akkermansia muciniphila TaxID=239935 RepID=UPI001C0642C4|nr:phosphoribosyltransferase family protein [Akkermansia muciniphila]QWP14860.1 hypothetical protein J5W66_01290 [Akkermansia muciniphila]
MSALLVWRGGVAGSVRSDVPVPGIHTTFLTFCDTGATLDEVCRELKRRGVKEVLTAVAVDKHCCRKVPFEADYVAFTQGNDFLVGFGMDLDGHYRELPYIGKVVMADTVENSD